MILKESWNSITESTYVNKTGVDLIRALMEEKEVFLYSGEYCITNGFL